MCFPIGFHKNEGFSCREHIESMYHMYLHCSYHSRSFIFSKMNWKGFIRLFSGLHSLKGNVMIQISRFVLFFVLNLLQWSILTCSFQQWSFFSSFGPISCDNESFSSVNLENYAFCAILTLKLNFFLQKSLKTSTNA